MVIPAAGRARRFGSGQNKIWSLIHGKPLWEWTVSEFDSHPEIDSIILVTNRDDFETITTEAAQFTKVTSVVVGGNTRSESVRIGMEACPADIAIILVHDAARPLISSEVISRVIEGVRDVGAAVPGLPLSDTVKRIDTNGFIRATIPRTDTSSIDSITGLTSVQTPQGSRIELLRAAYEHFNLSDFEPTDEASLLENLGVPVVIVPGDPLNIKITRQEDIALAEQLKGLSFFSPISKDIETENKKLDTAYSVSGPEFRTGFGYDVHAFASPEAGRKLFMGGVEIPHDRGLEGHSDADVLLHAICDALLGGASMGDIGILFPNTDERYRNVSSLELLAVVRDRIREAGWSVVNIDSAVTAEAPRLMPHRERMQRAIAECLHIEPSRISVKATTNEKMGFVGRGEGIACWANAMLRSSS